LCRYTEAFAKYPTFQKAKIIKDKSSGKSKGFGFVSLLDSADYIKVGWASAGRLTRELKARLTALVCKVSNVILHDPGFHRIAPPLCDEQTLRAGDEGDERAVHRQPAVQAQEVGLGQQKRPEQREKQDCAQA
jgi:hypothetical protein